jgi:cysteine desulfurase family protein (TIGR01976 family)
MTDTAPNEPSRSDASPSAPSSLRNRFPTVAASTWARFDGPAGTQMVDVAIQATYDWMIGDGYACGGGYFDASQATAALVDRTRSTVGRLFNADSSGLVFGPNMTTLTFAVSRAIGQTLRPGDRIVGTRLDHDANVSPWMLAAAGAGAEHVLAPFDPHAGNLQLDDILPLIDERTKWVTLPGASNLLGSVPDHRPIIDAAHAVGALVFVDAVAWAPHAAIDVEELGCDALVTSPYKWYAPHIGMLWMRPELLQSLPVFKVRPAYDSGPSRLETGMPNYEGLAGTEAAARFLLEAGMDAVGAYEMTVFEPLLRGLQETQGVRVYGEQGLERRCPTVAFTIDGVTPSDATQALAAQQIAVWDGHNYAVEVVDQLGLADSGGVIRAGLNRYSDIDDVDRLLTAVRALASGAR